MKIQKTQETNVMFFYHSRLARLWSAGYATLDDLKESAKLIRDYLRNK